ncbi:MAG: hypothetical protein WA823_10640 [Candidatus Acidiferrales bacterium]
MKHVSPHGARNRAILFTFVLAAAYAVGFFVAPVHGQGGDAGGMQAKMMELKESMAKNKAALATYTWNETVTISLKGEVKKVQHYQVREGSDGKPQKTSLDPAAAPAQPQGGRLKQHVVAKKKEEYEDYAEKMKALAQQYVPPDKDLIQAAYAKGNVSFAPGPVDTKITITNYVKPGDSVVMMFSKANKQITSIAIKSYMDDPSDGMNLNVTFSSLPDGTSHVATTSIDGVSKQLMVATQNGAYQKL